ncbi:uncharacterized serine-rich protein C215.13 [Gastrolobium bilobum]|uniref:uncharacterized serine-rich protein C215.13 n=1 Tax=Gastrolobium bilobum TaxID=150636 RepID=UPI002AB007BF|nr:uncharacterized serine-rich protein C215.13 [Gastrolobium bilobum]
MGCCISKCRPEKHTLEDQFNHVQDKLVISQTQPTPILYSSKKILPSPSSPTSSTSSISSFTCTTSNTICSASSLSTASSSLSSKDRSFSNDFLWSCYKENPHITRMNSIREATLSSMPTKPKAQSMKITNPSPIKPILAPILKQSPSQKVVGSFSMPQKRVRSNSPTNLTRQKSFRKEPERNISVNSASNMLSRTTLGSPSPSRRFNNGDKCGSALGNTFADNSVSKRMISAPKVSATHSHCVSSYLRKESVKAASPNNSSRRVHSGLRHRETRTLRVGSKIDETVVNDVLYNHDMDSTMMEDINNPLISLDCFIFL